MVGPDQNHDSGRGNKATLVDFTGMLDSATYEMLEVIQWPLACK